MLIAIILTVIPVTVFFIVFPIAASSVYKSVFGKRYQTPSWIKYSTGDFDGLQVERSDFQSAGVTLAGYKYFKNSQKINGLVIVAHGLGGGGHNSYMPFIDYFTSNGYLVFTYDARGNDNSGGYCVGGLPQGIVDLDNAINYAGSIEEYTNLPIVLFGHSWGGYSVGNVLNLHSEVKAAVIIAGFNSSTDLISYQGERMVGKIARVLPPYIRLLERFKFGRKYASLTAVQGMKKTDAGILIAHSKDDTTVPSQYGYDKYYTLFADSERFTFIHSEDKGHEYLMYSDNAKIRRDRLNADYKLYIENNGGVYTSELKAEYMTAHLDKKQCFEPDLIFMKNVISLYDKYCSAEYKEQNNE